ncbi:MAG: hypothetical protein ABEJ73_12415 [Haloplanus sp.]
MSYQDDLPETSSYSPTAVLISAVGGLILAIVSVWWAAGTAVFYEGLFRVSPTVEGGGVGADWVAGNTVPALDFLIAFIHAADVLLGLFILLLVFIHWGAFRRLADQMQQPSEERGEAVATDGGESE